MSKIEQMIHKLLPEWVAYCDLAEVAEYVRGVTYSKSDESLSGEGYKILRSNNISLSSNTLNLEDVRHISKSVKLRPNQKLREGDILISAASGSREHVGKVAYISSNIDYYFGGFMAVIRANDIIDSRFLFHLLVGNTFAAYLNKVLTSTTINNLSAGIVGGFKVPIPPPEIQHEIVRALDSFTELEAELETELEARKKQYEYYREMLLDYREGSKKLTLGDIFTMKAGKGISASNISKVVTSEHPFPCYGGGELRGYVKSPSHNGEYVIIGRQGALCGNVKRAKGQFYATEHAVVVSPRVEVDMDWAFYLLHSMNLNQYATKSAQPGLSVQRIEVLSILVPPISEQKRIADTLNKFDALVSDISQGLPAELAARRKQYEYYRNKLLTFPEASHA